MKKTKHIHKASFHILLNERKIVGRGKKYSNSMLWTKKTIESAQSNPENLFPYTLFLLVFLYKSQIILRNIMEKNIEEIKT